MSSAVVAAQTPCRSLSLCQHCDANVRWSSVTSQGVGVMKCKSRLGCGLDDQDGGRRCRSQNVRPIEVVAAVILSGLKVLEHEAVHLYRVPRLRMNRIVQYIYFLCFNFLCVHRFVLCSAAEV